MTTVTYHVGEVGPRRCKARPGNCPFALAEPSKQTHYTVEWSDSKYLGQYLEPGQHFAKDGEIYRANDWEWNRALLSTSINATAVSTGEDVTLTIHHGWEHQVTFVDEENTINVPGIGRMPLSNLNENGDSSLNEAVAAAFAEGETIDSGVQTLDSGRQFYLDTRTVTLFGKTFYAFRESDVPFEAEDDVRDFMRNTEFFSSSTEASKRFDSAMASARYW